ncbi:hypothetical protein EDB83DRAFT_732180 [Lactarius deliciosus]|nr:hypothetical protein EDB83DRAFT_732180 [Lactarius deliciosus]
METIHISAACRIAGDLTASLTGPLLASSGSSTQTSDFAADSNSWRGAFLDLKSPRLSTENLIYRDLRRFGSSASRTTSGSVFISAPASITFYERPSRRPLGLVRCCCQYDQFGAISSSVSRGTMPPSCYRAPRGRNEYLPIPEVLLALGCVLEFVSRRLPGSILKLLEPGNNLPVLTAHYTASHAVTALWDEYRNDCPSRTGCRLTFGPTRPLDRSAASSLPPPEAPRSRVYI